MARLIINPTNFGMTEIRVNQYGDEERYFSWSVGKKFPTLMFFLGFSNIAFVLIPCYFLKDPNHITQNFIPWIKAYFQGNQEALNSLNQTMKNIETQSISTFKQTEERSLGRSSMSTSRYEDSLISENVLIISEEEAQERASVIV